MRISELSRRSGVTNATIKYYLREGLLPPGRPTGATQAEYGEQHLRRLRLIRALINVRKLTVQQTREVLSAVTEHGTELHDVLGLVLGARPVDLTEEPRDDSPAAGFEVDDLVEAMGWQISPYSPARGVVTETLETMRSLGVDYDWRALLPYAELAERTAALDLDQLTGAGDALERAERAVLLTVLLEPALLALRRLAQENESAERHGT